MAAMEAIRVTGPRTSRSCWERCCASISTIPRVPPNCTPLLPRILFSERSEEHTSELQSRLQLVCRLSRSSLFPTRRSSDLGGMIEFGPDGFLYIGMGDGGNGGDPGNRAQNLEELLGKMLRIDIDNPESSTKLYSSPSTNPFFGSTAGRDEIYAVGLRNPWRYSFDRGTGQLYAGDVGQNDVEEVDIITLGKI